MPDNLIILRTQFESVETERDIERLAKQVRNFKKEQALGSADQIKAGKLLNQIENEKHAWAQIGYSDNAKMKESYFSLGTELRKFYMEQRLGDRTLRESTQVLQSFTNIFAPNISNNITQVAASYQQMEFAINSVGLSAQSAGGRFASMGAAIVGIAGPLAIAAGSTGFLATSTKELADSVQVLADKLALLRGDKDSQATALGGQIQRANEPGAYEKLTGAIAGPVAGQFPLLGIWLGLKSRELELTRQTNAEELKGKLDTLQYGPSLQVLQEAERKERERNIQRIKEEEQARERANVMRGPYGPGPFRALRGGRTEALAQWPKDIGGVAGYTPAELRGQDIQFMAEHGMRPGAATVSESRKLTAEMQNVKSAAIAAGNAISSSIGVALTQSLGLTNDLASQLLSIAIDLGIRAVSISMFPGLFGVAGGAGAGAAAGAIPKPGAPIRGGGGMGIHFGVVKVGLTELSMAVERGDRLRAQTTLR